MKDIHIAGGNYFDDMRIDIDAAFEIEMNRNVVKKHNSIIYNFAKGIKDGFLVKTNLLEAMVITGLRRKWFKEFSLFWKNVLDGRPLNVMDFHMLRMWYRVESQKTESLSWNNIEEHMNNWKKYENISILFQQIYNNAISPYKALSFVHKGDRVLEYGCSHAPYYRAYREYHSHKKVKWVLADIKNISFLFSRYIYSNDFDIEDFIIIDERNADNPLENTEGGFDVIILTKVLEHLHNPKMIVGMLFSRLNRGGVFAFDYVKSEAIGLDSRQGLEQRIDTLNYIKKNTVLIKGNLDNINESVSFCIARKK